MEKLLAVAGLSLGGWAGWAAGAPFGFFPAFLLSTVGTGLGLYVGRKIAREHF